MAEREQRSKRRRIVDSLDTGQPYYSKFIDKDHTILPNQWSFVVSGDQPINSFDWRRNQNNNNNMKQRNTDEEPSLDRRCFDGHSSEDYKSEKTMMITEEEHTHLIAHSSSSSSSSSSSDKTSELLRRSTKSRVPITIQDACDEPGFGPPLMIDASTSFDSGEWTMRDELRQQLYLLGLPAVCTFAVFHFLYQNIIDQTSTKSHRRRMYVHSSSDHHTTEYLRICQPITDDHKGQDQRRMFDQISFALADNLDDDDLTPPLPTTQSGTNQDRLRRHLRFVRKVGSRIKSAKGGADQKLFAFLLSGQKNPQNQFITSDNSLLKLVIVEAILERRLRDCYQSTNFSTLNDDGIDALAAFISRVMFLHFGRIEKLEDTSSMMLIHEDDSTVFSDKDCGSGLMTSLQYLSDGRLSEASFARCFDAFKDIFLNETIADDLGLRSSSSQCRSEECIIINEEESEISTSVTSAAMVVDSQESWTADDIGHLLLTADDRRRSVINKSSVLFDISNSLNLRNIDKHLSPNATDSSIQDSVTDDTGLVMDIDVDDSDVGGLSLSTIDTRNEEECDDHPRESDFSEAFIPGKNNTFDLLCHRFLSIWEQLSSYLDCRSGKIRLSKLSRGHWSKQNLRLRDPLKLMRRAFEMTDHDDDEQDEKEGEGDPCVGISNVFWFFLCLTPVLYHEEFAQIHRRWLQHKSVRLCESPSLKKYPLISSFEYGSCLNPRWFPLIPGCDLTETLKNCVSYWFYIADISDDGRLNIEDLEHWKISDDGRCFSALRSQIRVLGSGSDTRARSIGLSISRERLLLSLECQSDTTDEIVHSSDTTADVSGLTAFQLFGQLFLKQARIRES